MNRHLEAEPKTDAELFDMLHGLFGIGDFTDQDGAPWHRFRMVEIGKIKALRKKRHLTLEHLAVVARYCYRHDVVIHSCFGMLKHIGPALNERRQAAVLELGERMSAAADRAAARGETDWSERLLLAQGQFRWQLLDEWETYERTLT